MRAENSAMPPLNARLPGDSNINESAPVTNSCRPSVTTRASRCARMRSKTSGQSPTFTAAAWMARTSDAVAGMPSEPVFNLAMDFASLVSRARVGRRLSGAGRSGVPDTASAPEESCEFSLSPTACQLAIDHPRPRPPCGQTGGHPARRLGYACQFR
ncbi:hypothetical protein RA210_U250031 [Rubrivivax sp. A210]|nr:hypothetical protein RA210_U250031 [Rubrivivax sp. A210]